MTFVAAAPRGVPAFDRRAFAAAARPRAVQRGVAISLGTLSGATVMTGAVTVAAAWMIALTLGPAAHFPGRSPLALPTDALTRPFSRLGGAANLSGLAGFSADAADTGAIPAVRAADSGKGTPPDGDVILTAALPSAPAPQAAPNKPPQGASQVPGLRSRPPREPQISTAHEIAARPAEPIAPKVAAIAPASAAPSAPATRGNAIFLPAPDSRTALYDIEAHTVYLPSGLRLEAHSGLGRRLDDPRYVGEKNRGPTPPNIYDLKLREAPFHGVRAIRLNPVDDDKMFGRDGILAHTYMLGPSGQSFGCVSFRNYPEFLKAYLRGEIDRLVVVPHLETKTAREQPARRVILSSPPEAPRRGPPA